MTVTFPACVPDLTDGVVRLRAHRPGDVPAIVEQSRDADMLRWTTVPRPYGDDDARGFLAMIEAGWNDPAGSLTWAIERVEAPGFAGSIDLRPRRAPGATPATADVAGRVAGSAEVGYGLHPGARGHGVTARALRLVCAWWFDHGGEQVTWFAHAGNVASWRVAWECGFVRRGDLPAYLPHPDGLADAWVATLVAGDDLTRPATPWRPGAIVPARDDTRTDGPMLGGERELLDHWLDLYRETLLLKIAGLDAEQLCRRAVPPSTLSLAGLVRHLTEVEAYWLREVLHGQDVPDRYCTPQRPDGDIDDVDPATAAADVAAYEREIAGTRALAAQWTDLDAPARGTRHGQALNLRWILTHLVEEYARHLGHADLLREAIDGSTGY